MTEKIKRGTWRLLPWQNSTKTDLQAPPSRSPSRSHDVASTQNSPRQAISSQSLKTQQPFVAEGGEVNSKKNNNDQCLENKEEEAFQKFLHIFGVLDKLEKENELEPKPKIYLNQLTPKTPETRDQQNSCQIYQQPYSGRPSVENRSEAISRMDPHSPLLSSRGHNLKVPAQRALILMKETIDSLKLDLSNTKNFLLKERDAFRGWAMLHSESIEDYCKSIEQEASAQHQSMQTQTDASSKGSYSISIQTAVWEFPQKLQNQFEIEKSRLHKQIEALNLELQKKQIEHRLQLESLSTTSKLQAFEIEKIKEHYSREKEQREKIYTSQIQRIYQNHRLQVRDTLSTSNKMLQEKEQVIASLKSELSVKVENMQKIQRRFNEKEEMLSKQKDSLIQEVNNLQTHVRFINGELETTKKEYFQLCEDNNRLMKKLHEEGGADVGFFNGSHCRSRRGSLASKAAQNHILGNSENEQLKSLLHQKDAKIQFLQKLVERRKNESREFSTQMHLYCTPEQKQIMQITPTKLSDVDIVPVKELRSPDEKIQHGARVSLNHRKKHLSQLKEESSDHSLVFASRVEFGQNRIANYSQAGDTHRVYTEGTENNHSKHAYLPYQGVKKADIAVSSEILNQSASKQFDYCYMGNLGSTQIPERGRMSYGEHQSVTMSMSYPFRPSVEQLQIDRIAQTYSQSFIDNQGQNSGSNFSKPEKRERLPYTKRTSYQPYNTVQKIGSGSYFMEDQIMSQTGLRSPNNKGFRHSQERESDRLRNFTPVMVSKSVVSASGQNMLPELSRLSAKIASLSQQLKSELAQSSKKIL